MVIQLLCLFFASSSYAMDIQKKEAEVLIEKGLCAEYMPTLLWEMCSKYPNDEASTFLTCLVPKPSMNVAIKPVFSPEWCKSMTPLILCHTRSLVKTQTLYENLSPHTIDRLAREMEDVIFSNKKAPAHSYNMAEELQNWLQPAIEFPQDLAALYTTSLTTSWAMQDDAQKGRLYLCTALGKVAYVLRHKEREMLFIAQPVDYEKLIKACIEGMVLTAQSKIRSIDDLLQVDTRVAEWTAQLLKTFGAQQAAPSSATSNLAADSNHFVAFA